MLSVTSARQLAAGCIQMVQTALQRPARPQSEREATSRWILGTPSLFAGRVWSLAEVVTSLAWAVPENDPDVTCVKVHHPQDGPIHVHQSLVCVCPEDFPSGSATTLSTLSDTEVEQETPTSTSRRVVTTLLSLMNLIYPTSSLQHSCREANS